MDKERWQEGTFLTPTLTVTSRLFVQLGRDDFGSDRRRRYISAAMWKSWDPATGLRRAPGAWNRENNMLQFRRAQQALLNARKAGVHVLAGSDSGAANSFILPGWSLHEELERMVGAGMKPVEALRAATLYAAEWRGKLADEGTVATGKKADLLLLRRNPLETIKNTRQIEGLLQGGRYYSRADLDRMLLQVEQKAVAGRP
jgi:predicted amidohydrolase YtcJ